MRMLEQERQLEHYATNFRKRRKILSPGLEEEKMNQKKEEVKTTSILPSIARS